MFLLTGAYALAIVTAFRVVHLWAGAVWVDRHIRDWLRRVIKAAPQDRMDFEVIAREFDRAHGTHALMIFGVKSYRITRACLRLEKSGRRVRRALLCTFQAFWRFFYYPLIVSLLLLAIAYTSDGRTAIEVPVWLSFMLIAFGCLGIVVEAYFSYATVGTWATWYHRHHGRTSETFELSKKLLLAGGRKARDAQIADAKKEAKYLFGTAALIFFPSAIASLCAAAAFSPVRHRTANGLLLDAVSGALGFVRFDIPAGQSSMWTVLAFFWVVIAIAFLVVLVQGSSPRQELMPLD